MTDRILAGWKGISLLVAFTLMSSNATPLDDYVNRPDPNYRYDVIDQYRGPDYTLYTINMTSQKWKTGYAFVFIARSSMM